MISKNECVVLASFEDCGERNCQYTLVHLLIQIKQ